MILEYIINRGLTSSVLLLVVIMLLSPLGALADEKPEKALLLCQAEVKYFSVNTGKVNKVVFPSEFHLKDMPISFIIEYRDDLKAGAYLKSGMKQALDVRCHIQKGTLDVFYVKINGKQIDTKDGKFDIPAGMLRNYINELGDTDFHLIRKNGTIAHWPNDIEILCRDFVLYKRLIPEYSQKGDKNGVAQLRSDFEATRKWLNEYDKNDVQTMISYLSR